MVFWMFMLLVDLMIPLSMLGFGNYFLRKAPKEINAVFGYRTTMSMKNRDTWEFAHKYCGRLWVRCGCVLLPLSVLPLLLVLGRDADTVGTVGGFICFLQLVPLIGSILPTERALKRTFDKNGIRRSYK